MTPPRSVLDRRFRWTSSAATDIRRTFARYRKQQKALAEQKREQAPLTLHN